MFVTGLIVVGLIAVVIGAAVFIKKRKEDSDVKILGAGAAVAGLLLAGITYGFTGFYTQDPGEAVVLRSFTGEVVGQTTSAGLKTKAPWVSKVYYDIRNQQVIFAAPTGDENIGANGPQITVQDAEGVSANIDITVRYSIDPDAVTTIYEKYQTQENFVSRFIENDIRAGVRAVPVQFTTLDLLTTGRLEAEAQVRSYLEERWEKQGVRVETVSLQEIRYSKEVTARFDAAQSARIEIEKAQAELEATEVSAQQQVVKAQAEAEANRILTQSLTEEVLAQRYLDTLTRVGKDGNLIIVPEGFNGILNTGK